MKMLSEDLECGRFVSLVHSVFIYMVLQIRPFCEEENDEASSLRIQFHVEIQQNPLLNHRILLTPVSPLKRTSQQN